MYSRVIKSVSTTDAYMLSLVGLVPPKLRREMYDKYISRLPASDETKNLIDKQLDQNTDI